MAETNPHDVTADDDRIRLHIRPIIAADEQAAEARAARQAVRKKAKVDDVQLKVLDLVLKMADWEPSEVRDFFSALVQYARIVNLPIGDVQLDLFAGVPEAAVPALDWYHRGFIAATTGRGAYGVAPDDCPADCMQDYLKGQEDGTARNAEALARKPDEPASIELDGSTLTEVDQDAVAAAEAQRQAEASSLTDDDGDIDPEKIDRAARKLKKGGFLEVVGAEAAA